MKTPIKSIAWSKWIDPLGRNRHEFEYLPEEEVENFDNNLEDMYENEEPVLEEANESSNNISPVPVILTPLGIVPIKPYNDATKIFNFWMGETNFNIGKKRRAIINAVPGVEILDVFTRYKFRIAVGNLFKFQDVRQNIEAALGVTNKFNDIENMVLDSVTKRKVQDIINDVSKNPYWAIYVLPSGEMNIATSLEQNEDFKEKINGYMEMRRMVGGAIFKYDEQNV